MFENEPKYIVMKTVREFYEEADGGVRPGTPEYADLMQNVEYQVQAVLREERD